MINLHEVNFSLVGILLKIQLTELKGVLFSGHPVYLKFQNFL